MSAQVSFTVTSHAFDRRTDSFLMTRPHCMQCSTVKIRASLKPMQAM